MPEKPATIRWTRTLRRRAALGALILAVAALATLVAARQAARPERGAAPLHRAAIRTLPEDVESVLTSFSYVQQDEGEKIAVAGKRVIRRGRRVLGLRSNLVKTNFIEGLTGSVRTPRGSTSFTAAAAEWDADAEHPMLLNREVSVAVNGRPPVPVDNARIYLKRGVMEVNDGSRSYLLR